MYSQGYVSFQEENSEVFSGKISIIFMYKTVKHIHLFWFYIYLWVGQDHMWSYNRDGMMVSRHDPRATMWRHKAECQVSIELGGYFHNTCGIL